MGWQRLTGQGICSPDTVTGLVIGDHTAEGRTDFDGTVATAGPGGNLASTQWSNRAGRRSKGLQLIMDAKLQNSCHLAASTASGREQGRLASVPAAPFPPHSPRGPQTWGG